MTARPSQCPKGHWEGRAVCCLPAARTALGCRNGRRNAARISGRAAWLRSVAGRVVAQVAKQFTIRRMRRLCGERYLDGLRGESRLGDERGLRAVRRARCVPQVPAPQPYLSHGSPEASRSGRRDPGGSIPEGREHRTGHAPDPARARGGRSLLPTSGSTEPSPVRVRSRQLMRAKVPKSAARSRPPEIRPVSTPRTT